MNTTKYICDCGAAYTPTPKYNDARVKCLTCIRNTKSSEVKLKAVEYLGGKCIDCGYNDHIVAFDFDHKDPSQKSFKISGTYIYRWSELQKELDKCELRCANCHRIRHYILEFGDIHG